MISFAEREYSDKEVYKILNPVIKRWFKKKFKTFAPCQKYAVKEIHNGKSVLISSPTGSGKTLSAFLSAINELFYLAQKGELEDNIYVLYISPLKTLNNDIEKNLNEPLREIYDIAEDGLPEIRVGVRTGDTSQNEKQKQARKPPHILITTPETLSIILNAPKFSKKLREIRYLIVDEVHSLAENKRGVHLSLSLERLENRCTTKPVRIGLSATISPIEEVAKFLVGYDNGEERDCLVVDVSYMKETDLKVVSPVDDLIYTPADEVSSSLYSLLDELISEHRTTLIFTNTRSGTERVVYHLKNTFGEKYVDSIGAHHSSLSKELRLDVENRLKKGELRAVVCSTSLELGIDIGYVDLVVLLGSPKSIARGLQRIGRSGHRLHDVSKGRIVVLDRDDLVECVVLAKKARERALDRIRIPENALDVLAQHLVGMSLEQRWSFHEAYELIKKAYPYRSLDESNLISMLRYLSGYYVDLEDKKVFGKLWFDEEERTFGRRGKMTRPIYYMNVGTIPDEVAVRVFADGRKYVGKIEEGFLEKLLPGDIFVLGGSTYKFKYARGMRAYVEDVKGRKPTVPSWFSEQLPLSFDLAYEIRKFRGEMKNKINKQSRAKIVRYLMTEYEIDKRTALAIQGYFIEQEKFALIPTNKSMIVEEFENEQGRNEYIFHTLVGRRVNSSLSRVIAHRITKMKKRNTGITVSDNGFVIILASDAKLKKDDIKKLLSAKNFDKDIKKALERTELLRRRFRHVSARSFLILKRYLNRYMSVGRQQMNSHILMGVIKKIDPDFPVLKETYREIMEDCMNIVDAKKLLKTIEKGTVNISFLESRELPSPFAFNLVTMGYSDTVLMEDKKEMIKILHSKVMEMIEGAES